MRYFTPELFRQINSPDDEVVERAQEAWEQAIAEYWERLRSLQEGMPTAVRELASVSLHDWEVAPVEDALGPQATPIRLSATSFGLLAVIPVRQEEQMIVLLYALWDPLRTSRPINEWPFTTVATHWLYDELDAVPHRQGLYVHRILFSDGSIVEVPFSGCSLIRVTARSAESAQREKSSESRPRRKLA